MDEGDTAPDTDSKEQMESSAFFNWLQKNHLNSKTIDILADEGFLDKKSFSVLRVEDIPDLNIKQLAQRKYLEKLLKQPGVSEPESCPSPSSGSIDVPQQMASSSNKVLASPEIENIEAESRVPQTGSQSNKEEHTGKSAQELEKNRPDSVNTTDVSTECKVEPTVDAKAVSQRQTDVSAEIDGTEEKAPNKDQVSADDNDESLAKQTEDLTKRGMSGVDQSEEWRDRFRNLLMLLGLNQYYPQKITLQDVQCPPHREPEDSPKNLPWDILQQLLMADNKARDFPVDKINKNRGPNRKRLTSPI